MVQINKKIFLTYDDVLLRPCYSECLPLETTLNSQFSKNISLSIPIVSAAMDTVTEAKTAIVMAQEGGIGVIHKNMPALKQAEEVVKVKKYETGVILNPITVSADDTLRKVKELKKKFKITGMPVVDENNLLVGILTNRDMRFEKENDKKVSEMMTRKEQLVTASIDVDKEVAMNILHKARVEKLPLINKEGILLGLKTIKDILKTLDYPNANKDSLGRLRVAGAIGTGENEYDRAVLLIKAGIDALVIDTAHGHSLGVFSMIKKIKEKFNKIDLIAGNVATVEACKDLCDLGIDGIKIGIGPGSICTTRVIAGIGVPQLSALLECADYCRKAAVPCIADGGIKYSGDLVKSLAAGAHSVMIGSLFAGTNESPGEMILYKGRSYKAYRGMGSMEAMSLGSKDRYGQGSVREESKLIPEGIEGQVPCRGPLSHTIFQLLGGLRSGMGYLGAPTLEILYEKAEFIMITQASLEESHPHNVMITKEASNYRLT